MAEQFVRQIGYTEMFEWQTIPESAYGLFVQFSKEEPEKVEPYHDKDGVLVGVSSVSARCISDDPEQWDKAYLYNELGDISISVVITGSGGIDISKYLNLTFSIGTAVSTSKLPPT